MKQYGHINFDTIHINAMLSQGYDVKIVMHKEIAEKASFRKDQYALVLPKWLGYECKNSLINRVFYLLTLIYIKSRLSFQSYDYTVVSNIDELTLGLLPLTKNMYLICHGSCRGFGNKIKSFFLEHLAKRNTLVVFNKEMAQPFIEHEAKVKIVSHGCVKPFLAETKTTSIPVIDGYSHIIFHPSPKIEETFIKEVYNEKYNNILKDSNTLLLLRNNPYEDKGLSNIKFINYHLKEEDYQKIFLQSSIILFAYPNSFHLQVSGVSYECISNQKKMLSLSNPSLSYCKDFYNYDPFFKNAEEMIEKIHILFAKPELNIIVKPEHLIPNYHEVFDD